MDIVNDGVPDARILISAEASMAEIYYTETVGLLPAVRERLLDPTRLVKAGNDALRENVVSSLVALNLDLGGNPAVLEEEDLLRLRQGLLEDMAIITKAVEQVAGYRAPDLEGLKRAQQDTVTKVSASVMQLEQLVEKQQKSVDEIDGLLVTLNRPSVRHALRNMIPEEEDIDSVFATIKDPSINPDLVKRALVKLNSHLDLLEQGRQFADVVAARERLFTNLQQQQKTLRTEKGQLEDAKKALGKFDQVEVLLTHLVPWLEQASKFVSHWHTLAQLIGASAQPAELHSALEAARDYLLAVRRSFEAASH